VLFLLFACYAPKAVATRAPISSSEVLSELLGGASRTRRTTRHIVRRSDGRFWPTSKNLVRGNRKE